MESLCVRSVLAEVSKKYDLQLCRFQKQLLRSQASSKIYTEVMVSTLPAMFKELKPSYSMLASNFFYVIRDKTLLRSCSLEVCSVGFSSGFQGGRLDTKYTRPWRDHLTNGRWSTRH